MAKQINILILKTGSTHLSLAKRRGDFEHWMQAQLPTENHQYTIVDVANDAELPGYDGWSAVLISGSHAMVSDHLPWSERTAEWLQLVVKKSIPLLGICYGHQLLAYALGGEVGDNPDGLEFGTVTIDLTPEAHDDALFSQLPASFQVQACHAQSLRRLPVGAQPLAVNAHNLHYAFRYGENAWGVQFHPEFDTEIMFGYIERNRHELLVEGKQPDRLIAAVKDTPFGAAILRNFANLLGGDVKF